MHHLNHGTFGRQHPLLRQASLFLANKYASRLEMAWLMVAARPTIGRPPSIAIFVVTTWLVACVLEPVQNEAHGCNHRQ